MTVERVHAYKGDSLFVGAFDAGWYRSTMWDLNESACYGRADTERNWWAASANWLSPYK